MSPRIVFPEAKVIPSPSALAMVGHEPEVAGRARLDVGNEMPMMMSIEAVAP